MDRKKYFINIGIEPYPNPKSKPLLYFRYVDGILPFSVMKQNTINFFQNLIFYSIHSCLVFTHKKEINKSLSFLDVLLEKSNKKFITSVYRKPTFTGQYTRLDLFGPKKRKINLIGTLVQWFSTTGPRTGAGSY